jgi:hypothetical protein
MVLLFYHEIGWEGNWGAYDAGDGIRYWILGECLTIDTQYRISNIHLQRVPLSVIISSVGVAATREVDLWT